MANGKVGWLAVVLVVAGASAPSVQGQTTVPLISVDTEVILKARDTELKVEKRVVATGDVLRVYRVDRVQGDWLWISGDGLSGWVRVSDVVPFSTAIPYYSDLIRDQPQNPLPYLMRGMVWHEKHDYDRALADLDEAVKLAPKDSVAYQNRGIVRLARKEYEKAIADFDEATKFDPRYAASYACRAQARAAMRDFDLAIADDNEAIRLDPNDVVKYHHRAACWTAKQEYERALIDYTEAIKINPNDAAAYNGRAWIWATAPDPRMRDGEKAVQSATRAGELTHWQDPYCIGTLAAAEAEAGNFEKAVSWQEKALALFGKIAPKDEGHKRRLTLYQARKPYRVESQNR